MIKIFKKLSKGVQRSIIVGAIGSIFGLAAILNIIYKDRITEDYFLYILYISLPITIIPLIAGLWIYSGFKGDK